LITASTATGSVAKRGRRTTAVQQRHGKAEPGHDDKEGEAHDHGRDDDAYRCEHQDEPLLACDVVDVDVQAAGEQSSPSTP
jgi:hypothetical protein